MIKRKSAGSNGETLRAAREMKLERTAELSDRLKYLRERQLSIG